MSSNEWTEADAIQNEINQITSMMCLDDLPQKSIKHHAMNEQLYDEKKTKNAATKTMIQPVKKTSK